MILIKAMSQPPFLAFSFMSVYFLFNAISIEKVLNKIIAVIKKYCISDSLKVIEKINKIVVKNRVK